MVDLILSSVAVQVALLWLYHRRAIWGFDSEAGAGATLDVRPKEVGDELEVVKAALRGQRAPREGSEAFERWLTLTSERSVLWEQHLGEVDALVGVERELIELTLQGMTPKEIAQFKGVSGFHIYNVRSRVRKKLGVPEDVDLGEFLREKSHQNIVIQQFTPPPLKN